MSITITPISDDMGVEITGITGAEAATPEVAGQIQAALDRYGVVVFPELHISDDDLAALARLLGDVVLPLHGALADHPEIAPITRDPDQDKMAQYREATFNWHTDGTMSDVPDKLTMLTADPYGRRGRGQHRVRHHLRRVRALPDDDKAADRRPPRPAFVRQRAAQDPPRSDREAARGMEHGAEA